MLAYADCSIIVLSNGDPRLCDCSKIIDAEMIPVTQDRPDKQKELSLKTDWKYLGILAFRFSPAVSSTQKPVLGYTPLFVPQQVKLEIFRPPQS